MQLLRLSSINTLRPFLTWLSTAWEDSLHKGRSIRFKVNAISTEPLLVEEKESQKEWIRPVILYARLKFEILAIKFRNHACQMWQKFWLSRSIRNPPHSGS